MNMEIFRNSEFGSIRVIEEDGKYLFCGSDVAKALGYSNPRLPIPFCVPRLKIFPGVPAPCGGGNTQKNWDIPERLSVTMRGVERNVPSPPQAVTRQ